MACVPTLKSEVLNVVVAEFPEPLSVPWLMLVLPSLNVTVPVGVPLPGAFVITVAVKVTDRPDEIGLAEALTVVVVAAGLTVWVRTADAELALKFWSPLV